MKFRTEIKIQKAAHTIDHNSKLVLIGSCFSEHMQEKFEYFKFQHCANPYGILFHPLAIERALKECIEQKVYSQEDLDFKNSTWLSYQHHSKFSGRDSEQVLKQINDEILRAGKALRKASHFIITLGTSWVYRKKKDGEFVANCHKIPQNEFTKELLGVDEINSSLSHMINRIQAINQDAKFIFTLSPVRHIKDGIEENSLSKARLLQAIHEVKNNNFVFYFPSYEIMMDDLRDYRFYGKDLIHPNEMAIDYIWDLFIQSWMDQQTRKKMEEVDKIQKSISHRPFDPESDQHKSFLKALQKRIKTLESEYPEIKF